MSWPRAVGQIPIFYRQRATGRPTKAGEHFSSSYLDVAAPQFFFGHRSLLQPLRVARLEVRTALGKGGEFIQVAVTVSNDSDFDGEATLFLFVHELVASVAPPLLNLKGVRKIVLKARERGQATWRLAIDDLSFIGLDQDRVLEPGRFQIHVGQSADPTGFLTEVTELTA